MAVLQWVMVAVWVALVPAVAGAVWWIRYTTPDRWRVPVSHAAASPRRAMPGYGRRAVCPAPLELERPVSRVTAVTVQATDAEVKR